VGGEQMIHDARSPTSIVITAVGNTVNGATPPTGAVIGVISDLPYALIDTAGNEVDF
jgi:hypothetical protein